ncbi:O-glucosyltransferase rumi-like protein [Bienertia sinuspersici]
MRSYITNKRKYLLYFYILLFIGCIYLVRRYDHIVPTTNRKSLDLSRSNNNSPITNPIKFTKKAEFPLICPPNKTTQKCPTNNYPTTINDYDEKQNSSSSSSSIESCPDYFRWIHEDLNPWKVKGITEEIVEEGKNEAFFRIIILDGRLYVEKYQKSYKKRDDFTIWGILQLLRLYPGKLPDLDLMFGSGDKTVINKSDYEGDYPVPMFQYSGDDEHFDIPFPDWSFWGWPESNIKPWEVQLEEMKNGNKNVKWEKRKPFAYWKGNSKLGNRKNLLKCNSTRSKTQIFEQLSTLEDRDDLKQSDIDDQCTFRYNIYMEGKAWSMNEKYLHACDSMLLIVEPKSYEFFSRGLLPLTHYWPINPSKLCESIKFAVNWGNKYRDQAQEIGKEGSKFIMEELKMRYIYDYMYHLLSEYGKLMKYRPSIPSNAIEICSEAMACNTIGKEKKWKFDSLIKAPSQTSPCSLPSAYHPQILKKFLSTKQEISRDVEGLEGVGL